MAAALDGAAQGLLGALAQALDCSVAGLWLPQDGLLVARTWWSEPSLDQAEFERISRELRLPRGIGLPGRAWERERPVSLKQLKADGGFIRREAADRAGLHGGLALPVSADGGVLGVIELFSAGESELTERLTHSLAGIGQEVGAFLAVRRGEVDFSQLTARQLEVLQLAAEGLSTQQIGERLLISSSTVKSHFEHIYDNLGVPDRVSAVAQALREGLIR
jgi:DNA-binding CsgD family transcriptional regulator